jgi:hypothetical protein
METGEETVAFRQIRFGAVKDHGHTNKFHYTTVLFLNKTILQNS